MGEDVFNLYDLTGGNYSVQRTLTFPQFPNSSIVFNTDVRSVSASEWETDLNVSGTYYGPTDVVSVQDYEVNWTLDGNTLRESGTATLVLSSGETLLSEWTSAIVVEGQDLRGFAPQGQIVRVSYSPFRIDADSMSYEWEGTVNLQER